MGSVMKVLLWSVLSWGVSVLLQSAESAPAAEAKTNRPSQLVTQAVSSVAPPVGTKEGSESSVATDKTLFSAGPRSATVPGEPLTLEGSAPKSTNQAETAAGLQGAIGQVGSPARTQFPNSNLSVPQAIPTSPIIPSTSGTGVRLTPPSSLGASSTNAPVSTIPAIHPSSTNYAALPGESLLAGTIDFPAAPLDQVLQFYAELTGRTVLHPAALPATQITLRTPRPLTKDEAIQALDTVLALNGITIMKIGEKFAIAVPSEQALQQAPPFDTTPASDLPEAGQYITKIVELKHILPSEAMPFLEPFAKVQNGLLPIDDSRTLVIRDHAANVKRMLELLERIDVERKSDYELAVIPIKYGKVEDLYNTMTSLITGQVQVSPPTGAPGTTAARAATAGAGVISRSGSDTTGLRAGYRSGMYPGLYYPQEAQIAGRPVAGAPSATFAQRLQQLLQGRGAEEIKLLENARIVPDQRSNSLIVYASKKDLELITNLVAKIDRLQAQVLIEAIVLDVQLTDDFQMGVSAYLKSHVGQWSHDFLSNPGSVFTTVTNFASSVGGGIGWIGHFKDDLTVVAQALTSTGKGQIIATPRIQTTHATPASFSVGQTVPYVTSTYYGSAYYPPSSTFQQMRVLTSLEVTPFITPDGLVVMEIVQHIEEIAGFRRFENVGELPETVMRDAQATVAVQDGDTIILGGYIRASRTKNNSGVPLLKDIPLLGMLFRSSSSKESRSEMVVLLRPTVLKTPQEAAIFAEGERRRLPGVSQLEQEMPNSQERLRQRTSRLDRP